MIGRTGEDIAARFFEDNNFRILSRNFRTRIGEIDIIASEGETLVFCEVKTRESMLYGHPIEAVTPRKQKTIKTIAEMYIANPQTTSQFDSIRFDVIAIIKSGSDYSLQHIRNAF